LSFPSKAATLLCQVDCSETGRRGFLEHAVGHQPLIALFQQLVHGERRPVAASSPAARPAHFPPCAMSRCAPPGGSGMMPSISFSFSKLVGGQAHCFGGVGGFIGALPQNRRAAFRRNHRIGAVLQHQHPVAHADRQRPAGTALADDHADHRYPQPAHLEQIAGDGLALAAFLGADAGIGARRVDEGHHRQAGTARPASSVAAPCGSLPGAAFRSCGKSSPWCRALSDGR
jgi:hypothetical protein